MCFWPEPPPNSRYSAPNSICVLWVTFPRHFDGTPMKGHWWLRGVCVDDARRWLMMMAVSRERVKLLRHVYVSFSKLRHIRNAVAICNSAAHGRRALPETTRYSMLQLSLPVSSHNLQLGVPPLRLVWEKWWFLVIGTHPDLRWCFRIIRRLPGQRRWFLIIGTHPHHKALVSDDWYSPTPEVLMAFTDFLILCRTARSPSRAWAPETQPGAINSTHYQDTSSQSLTLSTLSWFKTQTTLLPIT